MLAGGLALTIEPCSWGQRSTSTSPPDGVRVTSKCNLGNPPPEEIEPLLRQSIEGSLERLRLSRLDLFFLHSNVVPDANHIAQWPDAASRMTPYAIFVAHVRPVFERLVGEGGEPAR